MRMWIFGTDLHGDMQDKLAVRLFKKHTDKLNPDHRIFGGDLWDFRAWRNGASDFEKRDRVYSDFNAGMEFIKWFQPQAITLGNHDVRLWDQVEQGGPMAELCEELIAEFKQFCKSIKCRVLPYDKRFGVYKLGKAKFAHGFFSGPNAARQMGTAYGSILSGHVHSIDEASCPSAEDRCGRTVGCLCKLNFTYNRAHVAALRQQHGWAYGPVFDDGTFHAFQARVIKGKSVVSTKLETIGN
jgi:hypothetical protein